jgi:hypothetical protein
MDQVQERQVEAHERGRKTWGYATIALSLLALVSVISWIEFSQSVWSRFNPDLVQTFTIADLPLEVKESEEIQANKAGVEVVIEAGRFEFDTGKEVTNMPLMVVGDFSLPTGEVWVSSFHPSYKIVHIEPVDALISLRLSERGQEALRTQNENLIGARAFADSAWFIAFACLAGYFWHSNTRRLRQLQNQTQTHIVEKEETS